MPVMDFYQILCYTGLKISKEGGTSMPVRGYKRKRAKYRYGIPVFLLICALVWCALTGGYLLFGGLGVQTFQSTGIARVLTALLSAAFAVSVWCLCRWVLGLLHIQPGWPRLLLLSCVAIAVSLFMAFRIPFTLATTRTTCSLFWRSCCSVKIRCICRPTSQLFPPIT